MNNSFAFTFSIPSSVYRKLSPAFFAFVCSKFNSKLTFIGPSRAYSHYLDFRIDSPDLCSVNSSMNHLSDFRLNLIRNGFCRRHWYFGCIIKLSNSLYYVSSNKD